MPLNLEWLYLFNPNCFTFYRFFCFIFLHSTAICHICVCKFVAKNA